MNAKATRMLFAAVALSALAAMLASSAQARIPEGNGTQLGEIGAWAVPSTSHQKLQVLQQTSVGEKLGEIGAWAVPYLSQGIGVDKSLFAGHSRLNP